MAQPSTGILKRLFFAQNTVPGEFGEDDLFGDLLAFDIQHQLNIVRKGFVGFGASILVGQGVFSGGFRRADCGVE